MTDKVAELVDPTNNTSIDPKHASVSLPAASFDVDDLQKHLEKAVTAKPEKRIDVIDQALRAAAADERQLDQREAAAQDGFRFIEVKNEQLSALKGEDVIERIPAFDPKLADQVNKDPAANQPAPPATATKE